MSGGLKCRVPGCRTVIRAWTGLEELNKLRQHMRRVHGVDWDTNQALEWRARWEREAESKQGGDK